ncbi:MAG: glycosyltransferase [Sulfurimicrobium sp.]|nr:glycosyltransferase [Sulfurimicrobium sp.]MDP2199864.1 glycosyltransferase [Sulfurimicrobium sp.]MDP2962331.1 glycosyltransferase [Sulfurimicrobium sp.]MDP3687197.1 glycosyltransferase [Sulfurimicrobium sp.]MDZ7657091.1 glycosyltransferase [Sulfurimicrobium sp.]
MHPVNEMQVSNSGMRVSVVIPAYNSARFLRETIESVRQQTTPVHEIIVVDDGSTDETGQVIQSLGEGIVYVRQANAGVSAARNRGIAEARGEIIAFLDADDLWLPQKVENQVRVFLGNPDVALVATDRADIDEHGGLLLDSLFKYRGFYGFLYELGNGPIPHALSRLVQVNFIPTSSVMVRKSALNQAGDFNTSIRYGEDLDLWARIASQHAIACIPEVLTHYRRHGSNATQATENLLLDLVRVMKNIRSWGALALSKEGLNADKLVAQSLWDLGYWYFTSTAPRRAYNAFMESFRESPSLRTLIYAWLSLTPPGILGRLRKVKQKTIG